MLKITLSCCNFLIDFNYVSIATTVNMIFNFYFFYCMNKEICYSADGLWKVKTEYIVKGNLHLYFPFKNV